VAEDRVELNTGQTFHFVGPSLEKGPLPAFFYFSLSGSDSLHLDPYNRPAAPFAGEDARVFSASLPYHDEYGKKEVMEKWAEKLEADHDFLTPFLDQTHKSILELIEIGAADPGSLAVGGLSRGSLIAAHLAAREKRIHSMVLFAPLTKLKGSTSFVHLHDNHIMEDLSVYSLIPELIHTSVRLYIGNRDVMVGTTNAYEFIRQLTDAAFDEGVRSPQTELIISPSIGYKGHGTPEHIFKNGGEWIKKQLREQL
jgi:hypothetical protein